MSFKFLMTSVQPLYTIINQPLIGGINFGIALGGNTMCKS